MHFVVVVVSSSGTASKLILTRNVYEDILKTRQCRRETNWQRAVKLAADCSDISWRFTRQGELAAGYQIPVGHS